MNPQLFIRSEVSSVIMRPVTRRGGTGSLQKFDLSPEGRRRSTMMKAVIENPIGNKKSERNSEGNRRSDLREDGEKL